MAKTKKLKLKPSARDSRRYLLIKSQNSKVEATILEYIGVLGFAKSAYMKVTTQDFPGHIVGSCLAKSLDEIRAALVLSGIKIEKVSGTLKTLKG